jgi:hypothetical protein
MGDIPAPAYPSYPSYQPAQNSGNALINDPAKVIGLVSTLQDYRLKQQQFNALAQQPQATLDRTNIDNQTAMMGQQAAASKAVAGLIGGYLAGIPNPTADDVRGAKALAARSLPNIATQYPDIITAVGDVPLQHPKGIKFGSGVLLNSQLSPEGASNLVEGPPNPTTGAARKMTVPESNLTGGRDVSLAPGEEDLAKGAAERAAKLQATASTSPQYHADLENLRQESKVLGNVGGPTTDTEKKINQLLSRFGVEGTMTKEQLGAAESFAKIANQISLNQSTLFHGSDAGLHTVVSANPSLEQSRYGREGIIDMLHGNQDVVDVVRRAWLAARANGAALKDHDLFMDRIGQEIDPRVFQFNRLSRDNQQKFLLQMDPADLKEFEDKYKAATVRKWVKPLKAPDNGGQ